jgi:hypothetical protein
MSSRSAVLEEREELEDLKEDRMEYKEVRLLLLFYRLKRWSWQSSSWD